MNRTLPVRLIVTVKCACVINKESPPRLGQANRVTQGGPTETFHNQRLARVFGNTECRQSGTVAQGPIGLLRGRRELAAPVLAGMRTVKEFGSRAVRRSNRNSCSGWRT